MKTGEIFLGLVFLLVAAYIIIYVDSQAAKIFGGGILAILGILTLIKAFYKKGKKEPDKSPENLEEQ